MPLSVKELVNAPGVAVFLSFMFGLGVAAMFRPLCKGPDCVVVRGPPVNDIRDAVYQFGTKCIEFKTNAMECPTSNAVQVVDTVSFADYS